MGYKEIVLSIMIFLLCLVLYGMNILMIYLFKSKKKSPLISKNNKNNKIHIYNILEDPTFYIYILICLLYLFILLVNYFINNNKPDIIYIIDNLLSPLYIWVFYVFVYIIFYIVRYIISLWIVIIIPYTFNTLFVIIFLLYFVYNIFNIEYVIYILFFVILYETSKYLLTNFGDYKEYNYFDILFSDMIHILYYLLIFLFFFTLLLFFFNNKLKTEFSVIFIFLIIIYTIIINNPKVKETNELIIIIQNIEDFPHILNVKHKTSLYSSKKNDFYSLIIRFLIFILKLALTIISPLFIYLIFYISYGIIYIVLKNFSLKNFRTT